MLKKRAANIRLQAHWFQLWEEQKEYETGCTACISITFLLGISFFYHVNLKSMEGYEQMVSKQAQIARHMCCSPYVFCFHYLFVFLKCTGCTSSSGD